MSRSRNAMSYKFVLLVIAGVIGGTNAKAPSRVREGQVAKDFEFPGVVDLTFPGARVSTCGGALIGPRHVLTAGHCIDRSSDAIMVRAGIRDIREAAVERLVDKVVMHPDYIDQTKFKAVENDIAILVLKEPLPLLVPLIQPLMLPVREPMLGANYTFAGWGRDRPRHEEGEYRYELQSLVMTVDVGICLELPERFCAHSDIGALCPGDSGGPLMEAGRVYGIASASDCKIADSSNFVNVYYYASWIKDVMSST